MNIDILSQGDESVMNQTIFIVEDDEVLGNVVSLYLQQNGYDVTVFTNVEMAWKKINTQLPSLLLLDINLPGESGFELAKKYREKTDEGIIIFLTGNSQLEEKLTAFQLGADDYLTKPFLMEELVARVKAHLRKVPLRKEEKAKENVVIGDIRLDFVTKNVYKKDVEIPLFVKEKKLLFFLAENYNRVFSAERLFEILWGMDCDADLKTVAVHISNLRKKIEDDSKHPQYLHTVRGFGYKLYFEGCS